MKRGKKRGKKPTNPRAMERANENASFKRTTPKKNAGRMAKSGPAPAPDFAAKAKAVSSRLGSKGKTGAPIPKSMSSGETARFASRVRSAPVTTAPVGSPKPVDASPTPTTPTTTPTATRKGPSARAMERANPNASFKRAAAGVTSNPKPLKTGQPVKKIKPAKMARGGRLA